MEFNQKMNSELKSVMRKLTNCKSVGEGKTIKDKNKPKQTCLLFLFAEKEVPLQKLRIKMRKKRRNVYVCDRSVAY